MRQIIPFKKSIVLKSRFDTISSLSLEHDYKVNEEEIIGKFIVSGTYRATQASLIDEEIYETLPFEISLSDRIITESVELKIDDFTYEKTKEDELSLDIELLLNYEEETENKEERLERILQMVDPLDEEETEKNKVIEQNTLQNEERNIKEEKELIKEEILEPEQTILKITEEKKMNTVNTESLSTFVSDKKNYVTYKVYIVSEFEDFNTISKKFNISIKDLEEYNEIKELQVGDKVIIPYVFE